MSSLSGAVCACATLQKLRHTTSLPTLNDPVLSLLMRCIVCVFQYSRQDWRTAKLSLTFLLEFLLFHPYLTRRLG